MKIIINRIILISTVSFLLSSCFSGDSDDFVRRGSAYKANFIKRTDFENSVKITPPKAMVNAGKIYLKDNYMFIGDTNKGFHLYDNSNPENPSLMAFIEMPGVTDIAIRDDVYYANQAVDLIAFKLNIENREIQILKRIKNTFPPLVSPDGYIQKVGESNVVIDWN